MQGNTGGEDQKKKGLVQFKHPKTIGYCDGPYNKHRVRPIPINQLEAKCNFTFSGDFFVPQSLLDSVSPDVLSKLRSMSKKHPVTDPERLSERSQKPLEGLVVCNLGNKLGYSLFTSKPIKANTILFLYSGELIQGQYPPDACRYDYSWLHGSVLNVAIRPEFIGNLSRFLAHLPNDYQKYRKQLHEKLRLERPHAPPSVISSVLDAMLPQKRNIEIENIVFNDGASQADLVTCNVHLQTALMNAAPNEVPNAAPPNEVPVVVCYAPFDIPAHSPLGFDYGPKYWEAMPYSPLYINSLGHVIGQQSQPRLGPRESKTTLFLRNSIALFKRASSFLLPKRALSPADIKKAKTLYMKASIGFKEKQQWTMVAKCYGGVGYLSSDAKRYEEAISSFEEAIHITKIQIDRASPNTNHSELREMYDLYRHELLKNVRSLISKWREDASTQWDKEIKKHYQLAIQYYKKGEYFKCQMRIGFLLTLSSPNELKQYSRMILLSTQASCKREQGQLELAHELCEQALALYDPNEREQFKTHQNLLKKKAEIETMMQNREPDQKTRKFRNAS